MSSWKTITSSGNTEDAAGSGGGGGGAGRDRESGSLRTVTLEQILMHNFHDNRVEGLQRTVSGEKGSQVRPGMEHKPWWSRPAGFVEQRLITACTLLNPSQFFSLAGIAACGRMEDGEHAPLLRAFWGARGGLGSIQ